MRPFESATLTWVTDNPVITKELRGRMRGVRAYWVLLAYLLILSIAMFLAYLGWYTTQSSGGGMVGFVAGRIFFNTLFYSQACLVSLITPALTAGAISIEREQRTFEMIRCTMLKPSMVVFGKLLSSVSFVVLLLTCSLPLVSLCFLLGGVSPNEVVSAYLMLVCDAAMFGALGLVWSTAAANTAAATALSYGTIFLYFIVTLVPSVEALGARGMVSLTSLNPIGAVTSGAVSERYFMWTLPAWIPGMVANGLLAVLLSMLAINRLDDYPWRRAGMVRVMTFVYVASLLFLLFGGTSTVASTLNAFRPGSPVQSAMVITSIGLLFIALCGSILGTGDVLMFGDTPPERLVPELNPIKAIRQATLATAPLAAFLIGILIAAESMWALGATAGGIAPPGRVQVAITMAMFGLGVAGVGLLMSVIIRNRWGALLMTFLIIGAATVLPYLAYDNLGLLDYRKMHNPSQIDLLYLSPLSGFEDLFTQSSTLIFGWLPLHPVWEITSFIYFITGMVCLVAAPGIYRRLCAAGNLSL